MERRRRAVHLAVIAAVVFASATVCFAQKKEPIKIGFPAPLSGTASGWGESQLQGTTLAVEELNSAGGILGHPVELIKGDVESQEPGTVITVVRKLINRDKVQFILTGGINPSCVEFPIMQESKMPYLLMAYSQSHERIMKENPGKYTYIHNCATTYEDYKVQFADVVKMLEKDGKYKPVNQNIAVIKSQNEYSLYCGDGLRDTFKSRGWNVVIDETIPFGGRFTEFAPILSKIRQFKTAIVIYTDFTSANAASFLLDFIKDPTPSLVYLQASPSYPDFQKIMEGRQEGILWTYVDALLGPKAKDYVEKFRKRWNKKPDPYGVFNYDVTMIAAEAMRRSGNPFNREAVNKELLAKNFSYKGVAGTFEFEPQTHMAKYGPGFIEFVTKQEWEGKTTPLRSTLIYPTKYKNGEFRLPPWYAEGLKKYGN